MNFSTTVAGIPLEHPIMNAAGTCKRWEGEEGISTLLRSASAAVVLGSITLEPKPGNSGEVYFPDPDGHFALNSLGLPNPGAPYLQRPLPEMVKGIPDAGKPLFISVAGFSPNEYVQLALIAIQSGAHLVELNLGCPNVWGDDGQKPIASYHPALIEEILVTVNQAIKSDIPFAVKLSPLDPGRLRDAAQIIKSFGFIRAVTTCNTFPNGFAWKGGQQAISHLDGLAGVSGPALKPIGLGQVRQFRALLPERIDIIGVGGIQTGQDVVDYLRAGATAVQVATALINRGPRVFSELLSEYAELAS